MYKYTLTEAYSEIYDHRKIEESFDNLRFVDHMLPEHIEEVIEELVWEFRDYGHTLEESFEMIDYALEDEVICESYDQLIADVLYEATITYGKGDIAGNQRRMAASIAAKKQAAEAEQQAKQRRDARRERIRSTARTVRNKLTGPISSVKQAVAGSAGGLAKSAKALGGKVVERGQALLKGLLRRGGKALGGVGKRMMASGINASNAPATTRSVNVGGRKVTVTTEPSEKTGSTRKTVGRAIRRVGVALQRKAGKRAAAARAEVGDAFAEPKTPVSSLKRNVPGRKERASSGGIVSSGARLAPEKQGPSQLGLLPPKGAGTFTPSGNIRSDSQRTFALAKAKRAGRKALEQLRRTSARTQRVVAEDFDVLFHYLVEDLIDYGYSSTIDESYEYINTLDENTLIQIISEYLFE